MHLKSIFLAANVLLSAALAEQILIKSSIANVKEYVKSGCKDISANGLSDEQNYLECPESVNLINDGDQRMENRRIELSPIETKESDGTTPLPPNPFVDPESDKKKEPGPSEIPVPWGIDRTNQKYFTTDGYGSFGSYDGEGAHVYVIDSGININHPDFEGRAEFLADVSPVLTPEPDVAGDVKEKKTDDLFCKFHGTHVAGTAVSKTYGVAKKARVYDINVFHCPEGFGTSASVLAGINEAIKHAKSKGEEHIKKSVINMSLGGPDDPVINAAVKEATDLGIHVIVAAGNSARDACFGSPGNAESAITVGAITYEDRLATFSNVGTCVDILAPGVDIESTSFWGRGSLKLGGTSMASPHVAGVVALLIAKRAYTADEMRDELINLSVKDHARELPQGSGTPNRILQAPVDPEEQQVKDLMDSLNLLGPNALKLLDTLRTSVHALGDARKDRKLGDKNVRKGISKEVDVLRKAIKELYNHAKFVSRDVKKFKV